MRADLDQRANGGETRRRIVQLSVKFDDAQAEPPRSIRVRTGLPSFDRAGAEEELGPRCQLSREETMRAAHSPEEVAVVSTTMS
jgi:hypothetical protein